MPRIPYPDPERLTDAVRRSLGGEPANVIRMMAGATPRVFEGFNAFTGSLFKASPLDPQLRELAILRVGYLSGSDYEVFQHEAFARHIGMSDAMIDAIRHGDLNSSAFGDVERAVMAFTDDIVVNVRASDQTLEAVRQHLDDTLVIDLIFVIGAYMMVSRFLETTGVEIDADPIDWKNFTDQE